MNMRIRFWIFRADLFGRIEKKNALANNNKNLLNLRSAPTLFFAMRTRQMLVIFTAHIMACFSSTILCFFSRFNSIFAAEERALHQMMTN
jgi:hypothetical protein